jgi:hypothetical protein
VPALEWPKLPTIAAVGEFVPGIELSRAFYAEVVLPLLGDTPHSAGRLGPGSDVLGVDTERSTDHGWGPRLTVFVEDDAAVADLPGRLDDQLPEEFRGWPVRFGWDAVPVGHWVEAATPRAWFEECIGFDPAAGISYADWLTTPQQRLLEATAGAVFHDGLEALEPRRRALAWYPDELWLWLLACQWRRIDQEEPFVGRTAEVGDELGSRILAGRLARDAVRLCLLIDRRFAPYSKWLGSAFARLDGADEISAALERAATADRFSDREEALVEALQRLAERHNALGVTKPVSTEIGLFHSRPFRVLGSSRFVEACLERVEDPWLRGLPLIGAIDQFVDSVDVLSDTGLVRRFSAVYG